MSSHPHLCNSFHISFPPYYGSFHTDLKQIMPICDISDLKVRVEGAAPSLVKHGDHVLSVLGKTVLFAINTAWIYLFVGGNIYFNVCFVVEYDITAGTSFSLETGNFVQART